jgi:predicted nucleic acid-binding protein
MPFVLDASMTMSWCFADESNPYSRRVLDSLLDSYAEVPALWPFEIANVLAVNEKRRRLTKTASVEFLQTLSGLDIRIDKVISYGGRQGFAPFGLALWPDGL